MQLQMDFDTASKINVERLRGQNLRLYEYLLTGNPIHVFHPAKRELRIGFINSRASDLINKHHVPIHKEFKKVKDIDGEEVTVVEYRILPEDLNQLNRTA